MNDSHPDRKILRISPLEIPTILPSRDERASGGGFGLSSPVFSGASETLEPVVASIAASPLPPVFPHLSQNLGNSSGPRTHSMELKPSEESRSRYPCARKESELSRSKMRKGMEARRRDRPSKRDARPAPEMMIGFWVLMGMVMM